MTLDVTGQEARLPQSRLCDSRIVVVVPGGGIEPPRYCYRRILSQSDFIIG